MQAVRIAKDLYVNLDYTAKRVMKHVTGTAEFLHVRHAHAMFVTGYPVNV